MVTDSAALQILSNALQAADMRQSVYSNNIANMQTPGYHREDVQFESVLQSALASSGGLALGNTNPVNSQGLNFSAGAAVLPVVTQSTSTMVDNNGNSVDIDAEMSAMAQNQLRYESLVQDVQDRLSRLKTAINGG